MAPRLRAARPAFPTRDCRFGKGAHSPLLELSPASLVLSVTVRRTRAGYLDTRGRLESQCCGQKSRAPGARQAWVWGPESRVSLQGGQRQWDGPGPPSPREVGARPVAVGGSPTCACGGG